MENAPDLAFIEAMERALMSGDKSAAARYLDDAVVYTVGARPRVTGVDAIVAYIKRQSRFARWDGHTVHGSWSIADGLAVEVDSHFTRVSNGKKFTLPCVDIYRFRRGRISDWRVYADLSVFAEKFDPLGG
jgi:ketosteroid isomerase-like protein